MEPHRGRSRWNMDKSGLQRGISREPDRWDTIAPHRGQSGWNTVKSSSSERPRPGDSRGYDYLSVCWTRLIQLHHDFWCRFFSLHWDYLKNILFLVHSHSFLYISCCPCNAFSTKKKSSVPLSLCLWLEEKITSARMFSVSTNLFLWGETSAFSTVVTSSFW